MTIKELESKKQYLFESPWKSSRSCRSEKQYDESVKNLLSNTQILAWIIKWTMVEFRDMELEEIIPYIGSPNVSGIAVDPGLTNQKIEGENTESKIKGEGLVTYDVRVYVTNPKSNKKGEVRISVDIEAQKDPNPGYQLVPRGILYCGRMLSERIDKNVKHGDYDALEKVYSIWIVFNCPSKNANTISSYNIKHSSLYGYAEDTERSDLLNVIMVRVPEEDKLNDSIDPPSALHNMLYEVFVRKNEPEEKMTIMKERFGLNTIMEKEVNVMCNLSEAVAEEAANSKTTEIAIEMLKDGLSVEKTAQYSHLSIDKIEELKRTLEVIA